MMQAVFESSPFPRRSLALGVASAAIVTLLLDAATTRAEPSPTAWVRDVVSQVRDTVRERQAAPGSESDGISAVVAEQIVPKVDMTLVSRLVLGRHWREADGAQRGRFREEFRRLLVSTYTAAVRDNLDARIEYRSESIHEDGDRTVVRTRVEPEGRQPIDVDYRLIRRGGEWRLYDVVVDGVSMVTNYRRQFDARIDAAGMDGFLDELEAKNRRSSSS